MCCVAPTIDAYFIQGGQGPCICIDSIWEREKKWLKRYGTLYVEEADVVREAICSYGIRFELRIDRECVLQKGTAGCYQGMENRCLKDYVELKGEGIEGTEALKDIQFLLSHSKLQQCRKSSVPLYPASFFFFFKMRFCIFFFKISSQHSTKYMITRTSECPCYALCYVMGEKYCCKGRFRRLKL